MKAATTVRLTLVEMSERIGAPSLEGIFSVLHRNA
jgi:hypothetical protein